MTSRFPRNAADEKSNLPLLEIIKYTPRMDKSMHITIRGVIFILKKSDSLNKVKIGTAATIIEALAAVV